MASGIKLLSKTNKDLVNKIKQLKIKNKTKIKTMVKMVRRLDKMNVKSMTLIRENMSLVKISKELQFDIRIKEEKIKRIEGQLRCQTEVSSVKDIELEQAKKEKHKMERNLEKVLKQREKVYQNIKIVKSKIKEIKEKVLCNKDSSEQDKKLRAPRKSFEPEINISAKVRSEYLEDVQKNITHSMPPKQSIFFQSFKDSSSKSCVSVI